MLGGCVPSFASTDEHLSFKWKAIMPLIRAKRSPINEPVALTEKPKHSSRVGLACTWTGPLL